MINRLAKFTFVLLGYIPLRIRSLIGYIGGLIAYHLPLREKKVAKLQIMHFLKTERPGPIIKRMFSSLGQVALESLNLKPFLANRSKFIKFHHPETWNRYVNSNCVVLTAHAGNWELLAALSVYDSVVPISTVGRKAHNPFFQELMTLIREDYGINVLWKSGKSEAISLMKKLKKKETVAALIDQDIVAESIMVPFFHEPCKTPTGLVLLAQKTNTPIFMPLIARTGFIKFEVYTYEIDTNLSVEEILTEYNKHLAELITEHPSQWVWVHKRWRTELSGKQLRTNEYISKFEERLLHENS